MTGPATMTALLAPVLLVTAPRDAGAQAVREPTYVFRDTLAPTATTAMHRPEVPSVPKLHLLTVATSAIGALLGGALGQGIDEARCKRENPERAPELFDDPCYIPLGDGAAAGWVGGATFGAAVAATAGGHRRGCPWGEATVRALGGAVAGAAPGLVVVASKPGSYRGTRAALVMSAPLLAGLGSAAAVAGCRR